MIDLPFHSGRVLVLRRFPTSSLGAGYTSIRHRDPSGKRFLHAGVIDIQRGFAVRRCCMQVTVGNRIAAHIGDPIRRLLGSAGEQVIHESQSARSRHSPRKHVLAANPILGVGFSLQDQDLAASASQFCGER